MYFQYVIHSLGQNTNPYIIWKDLIGEHHVQAMEITNCLWTTHNEISQLTGFGKPHSHISREAKPRASSSMKQSIYHKHNMNSQAINLEQIYMVTCHMSWSSNWNNNHQSHCNKEHVIQVIKYLSTHEIIKLPNQFAKITHQEQLNKNIIKSKQIRRVHQH